MAADGAPSARTAPRPPSGPAQAQVCPRPGALAPGWPLIWLLAGFPLWWALGIGYFAFWVFAVPMAVELVRRHRGPGLRLPPGFGLWALFLLWAVAGLALIGAVPPGTLADSGGLLGALARVISYLSVTVILLYVGNLSRRELPDLVVARALGWLCLATVAGGLLGMLAPAFEFTSPMELLLPGPIAADEYVRALVHPEAAQIMNVLGYESARPKAPWEFTNTWGYMLSLLLIWLVIGWVRAGRGWRRWTGAVAVALAVAPVVTSLNRALWAGLALSVAFAVVVLARRGRVAAAGACVLLVAAALAAVVASPLMSTLRERADNPHSDGGRAATSAAAREAAAASPVLGWGTTRDMAGSSQSIAIGKSPECPACGNPTIGNNGQFWLLLISTGWVGTALFLGFFARVVWRYRRDVSLVGGGALLTILLLFWYMFFYVALTAPLAVCMIATALLWRRATEPGAVPAATVGGDTA
ncbi:O-antigen ligase [Nocardiopsis mwathae]|uniref:O-antigen ligase n=1 Tax=Nocardiopsis mwathae TaxID=1472723 RepID=A0A7W9YJU5_9ACTN|nr:ligase [Nocardiopsis mwathae]MBB6173499.1 O-antigen ligase [Nocardiopsis mwathae]